MASLRRLSNSPVWIACITLPDGMQWENVDFVHGVIDFEPQKTKRKSNRIVVPLHPNLLAHLEDLASDRPETLLCPSLAGRPTGGKNGLSEQFKAIMRLRGSTHGRNWGREFAGSPS